MSEVEIIANGQALSTGQVAAVRLALLALVADLAEDKMFDFDPLGKTMGEAYRQRASEVLDLIGRDDP